jgi:hypothetical protein
MVAVAVVGGGLLGSVAALCAAARGWDVELIEARPSLLSAASAVNEGKVHLGPVFALGDAPTHEVMMRGALTFAPLLEEALDLEIDWKEITTDPFDYLVMPGSLLDAPGLADRYASMNSLFEHLSSTLGSRYLGQDIHRIVDPEPWDDPSTGFPAFTTTERAVDPLRLRELVLARVAATPNLSVQVSRRVLSFAPVPGGVDVTWQDTGAAPDSRSFDFVVNCAWESQSALAPAVAGLERNFRLKTAVRLPRMAGARTVTLVQGPFGDVVAHRDYTYLSWYPEGRLTHEFGREPGDETYRLLDAVVDPDPADTVGAAWRDSLTRRHVAAFRRLGLVPDDVESGELVGGIIVGHGRRDIDRLGSQLHSRAEFGAQEFGNLSTPRNFKRTTAPLAARKAIEAIEAAMARTVVA